MLTTVSTLPPPPPRQSPQQRALMENLEPIAAAASDAATAELLRLLDLPAFRAGLATCCPTISGLSAPALLELLEAEVAAAEVTHNFDGINGGWAHEVSISTLSNSSYMYNLWELQYLGLVPKDTCQTFWSNDLEVNLLGFPAFSGPWDYYNASGDDHDGWGGCATPQHRLPATYEEASQRPIYCSINLLGYGMGVPRYGNVLAVMSSAYVHDLVVISPIDTGLYSIQCNKSGVVGADCANDGWGQGWRCSGWHEWDGAPAAAHAPGSPFGNPPGGTFKSFRHMFVANAYVRSCGTTPEAVLLKNFRRLWGPVGSVGSADHKDDLWETNIGGTPHFPDGVKFLVGDAATYIGTPHGEALRELAIKWGWALAWSPSPGDDWEGTIGVPDAWLPQRVLDPWVASRTTANVSIDSPTLTAFEYEWLRADETRANQTALWARVWAAAPPRLRIAPMRAGDCADVECLGADESGDCVCYGGGAAAGGDPPSSATVHLVSSVAMLSALGGLALGCVGAYVMMRWRTAKVARRRSSLLDLAAARSDESPGGPGVRINKASAKASSSAAPAAVAMSACS